MRIGDLRHRVTFQDWTKVSDGMGGTVNTPADICTVFAAIWPVGAAEQVAAGQLVMTVTHRIRIRYRSDITAKLRVKFGTRYFAIVSLINPNEQGKLLDLLCKEAA